MDLQESDILIGHRYRSKINKDTIVKIDSYCILKMKVKDTWEDAVIYIVENKYKTICCVPISTFIELFEKDDNEKYIKL